MAKPRRSKCRTTWNTRNNSANVAAILHPKNYDSDSCRLSKHNNCYCNDSPIRPTLFSRPKSCFFDDNRDVTSPIGETSNNFFCQHDKNNNTSQNFSSNDKNWRYNKATDDVTFLQLPEDNVANWRSNEATDDVTFLQLLDDNVANLNKNDSGSSLNDFRKLHYFETHSVADLAESVPSHACVHRFGLDSRFLPEPLNADAFGVSRCVICGKPMESPAKNRGGVDERTTKIRGVLPKFYKYGLAPKRVHIGNGDVKIEVVAKSGDFDDSSAGGGGERPEYFNTFALRYQKGVGRP